MVYLLLLTLVLAPTYVFRFSFLHLPRLLWYGFFILDYLPGSLAYLKKQRQRLYKI